MDGKIANATQKLDAALKAAADAAAELQRLLPEHKGVPHYSVVEQAAHEVGVRLSCLIQNQRVSDIAAEAGPRARCPACQKLCEVECRTRTVKSIDGEVEVIEPKARCSRCERDFFPSTHAVGVGQPATHTGLGQENHDCGRQRPLRSRSGENDL